MKQSKSTYKLLLYEQAIEVESKSKESAWV